MSTPDLLQQALEALKRIRQRASSDAPCEELEDAQRDLRHIHAIACDGIAAIEAAKAQSSPAVKTRAARIYEILKAGRTVPTEQVIEVLELISASPAVELPVVSGFIGVSSEADFEKNTWTFVMEPGYRVAAGRYLITRVVPPAAQGAKP